MDSPDPAAEDLVLALTAFADPRTPSRIRSVLREEGRGGLRDRYRSLIPERKKEVEEKAARMREKEIGVLLAGDAHYPSRMDFASSTCPVLFYWGNLDLLNAPCIGMCGSRHVSELGLKAASACGEEVSGNGFVVVSGYAKGVDTATHLAALRGGGGTIIVLAEGFDHFRIKRTFPRSLFRRENVLVLSQFPPRQPWSAGGAMTRNRIIYGLGLALVVIEAGEKGGTLAAGEGALSQGVPVFVLDFSDSTPPGNRKLLAEGGIPIPTRKALGTAIRQLPSEEGKSHSQPPLL